MWPLKARWSLSLGRFRRRQDGSFKSLVSRHTMDNRFLVAFQYIVLALISSPQDSFQPSPEAAKRQFQPASAATASTVWWKTEPQSLCRAILVPVNALTVTFWNSWFDSFQATAGPWSEEGLSSEFLWFMKFYRSENVRRWAGCVVWLGDHHIVGTGGAGWAGLGDELWRWKRW